MLGPPKATMAVPSTPSRKDRRKSWFGFSTPTRKDKGASVAPRTSQLPEPAEDALEELDTTPTRKSSEPPRGGWLLDPDDSDSGPYGTIKRRRPPLLVDQSAGTPGGFRQQNADALAKLSGGESPVAAKPKPKLSARIFSRTASERSTPIPDTSSPALASLAPATKVSRRHTTLAADLEGDVDLIDLPANDQGGSPMNKPLPSIPLHDEALPPRSVSLPPPDAVAPRGGVLPAQFPIPPTDIVITPSSPLDKDPFADVFGALNSPTRSTSSAPVSRQPSVARTARATSQPRQSSPTPKSRANGTTPTSAAAAAAAGGSAGIGLGLPETNTRRISAPPGVMLPTKISVSSPLPMRTGSVGPKVTFNPAADDASHDYDNKELPKVKAPRPRSFSAMLGRSPLLNLGDQTDDEDTGGSSKFNWLGVRKTIRRRRSESKLNKRRSFASGFMSQNEDSNDKDSIHSNNTLTTPSITTSSTNEQRSGSNTTARPMAIPGSLQRERAPLVNGGGGSTTSSSTASSLPLYILPAVTVENEAFWPPHGGFVESPAEEKEEMVLETGSRESLTTRTRRQDASRTSSIASTPLESLPEGSPAPAIPPIAEDSLEPPASVAARAARGRSFSDAARRTYVPPVDEGPPSLSSSPRSPFLSTLPVESSPKSSGIFRPAMSSRSSSSSSAVLGKVRSVFGSRPRSNSTLRYGYGGSVSADEREDVRSDTPHTRPESSASAASSFVPSPALPPVRIRPEDVPQVSQLQLQIGSEDDRRVVITETPERSPRSSYAASVGSQTQTQATRRSITALDPYLQAGSVRNARARASTISSGAISWQGTFGGAGQMTNHPNHSTTGTFGHGSVHGGGGGAHSIHGQSTYSSSATYLPAPSSPLTFPTSATPTRTRSGSIRRLSKAILSASPSSPKPPSSGGGLFPLPPRSQSSGTLSVYAATGPSEELSPAPSSVPSSGAHTNGALTPKERAAADKARDKEAMSIRADDTPEAWVDRLSVVSRRELAGVLAESSDKFHMDALQTYMTRFDFHHIALDVALRRLLMDMSLPKETQQIDRVMEAFASRYDACEPGLFGEKDNAYVLAFSMMMLHTDAFNRHNKNKMNKADYVKNTRLDGVPEAVLETFYDNITFTPFVCIEDDNEAVLANMGASSNPLGAVRPGKIDVYDMIVSGQLSTLRVNVESMVPAESPFSCMGTRPFLDVDSLQRRFADAHPLKFVKNRLRRKQSLTSFGSRPASTEPGKAPGHGASDDLQTLNITKVGLISRKDDSIVNGKRVTGKKWKSWSVILTGSQLLFFKDTIWALTLVEQIRSAGKKEIQHMASFQPDEVLSVKDCVAVWDREYTATLNTFSFMMSHGRQFLMQATDEYEMNDWVALINYASTFKSAGIRMRAQAIDSGEAVMAGAAAAESHKRDLESGEGGAAGAGAGAAVATPVAAAFATTTTTSAGASTITRTSENSQTRAVLFADAVTVDDAPARPRLRRVGSMRATPTAVVDIVGANRTVVDGGEQLEAVIGSVKAELAAGRGGATRTMSLPPDADVIHKSLRTEAIGGQVKVLKESAAPIERRLAANLRLARNLAILTPFQKATRDRIELCIPELARQIRDDRVELSKLHLWLTMLLKDQDRDQREWARVRHVALQAAAKSLRGGLGLGPADRRATLAHPIAIPTLALPDHDPWVVDKSPNFSPAITPLGVSPASGNSPLGTSPAPGVGVDVDADADAAAGADADPRSPPAISTYASPPTSPRRPSDDESRHNRTSSESDYELAREYLSGSSLSLPDEVDKMFSSPEMVPGKLDEEVEKEKSGHVDVTTAAKDEAEDWRKTRAATKVSLAKLPAGKIGVLHKRVASGGGARAGLGGLV